MPFRDTDYLHPALQDHVNTFIREYPGVLGDMMFRITVSCTHRPIAEQKKAYDLGRSKCDGVDRPSMHNFLPSYAVDFVVLDTQGTPATGDDKASWSKKHYDPLGEIADDLGLQWGGWWKGFYDGPHIQLPKKLFFEDMQMMLAMEGEYDGDIDGLWGPLSKKALADFRKSAKLQERPMISTLDFNGLWNKHLNSSRHTWPSFWALRRQEHGLKT
jgi:hypothetical protein